jgi:hypothetical protein
MQSDWIGAGVVVALAFLLIALILQTRLGPRVKALLVVGLIFRLVGSQVYYYLSEWVYGFGDYSMYYGVGRQLAEEFWNGLPGGVNSPYLNVWGTAFTIRLTGWLLIVLGPTIHSAFLMFALVGYAGIVALAFAFSRAYPEMPLQRYLVWIVFFPSLWYWPAALGKDALILGGIGVAVFGFIGRRGRIGWIALVAGVALVYAIRPQAAAVLVSAMIGAHAVTLVKRWTFLRVVQAVGLAAAGVVVIGFASQAMGLTSVGDVEIYLNASAATSATGGSAIQGGGGLGQLLLGPINVLFRPFPWEIRGVASAIAALEITALWGLVLWKWKNIRAFFQTQRHSKLFWFSLIFVGMYALLAGLALGNIGLIARQRVHIFPFLFVFFAGRPVVRGVQRATSAVSRTPGPPAIHA